MTKLYYYDVLYRLSDGKLRWMYVMSFNEYKNGVPPFVYEKQYPNTWHDVKACSASEGRVKFIKWRESNRYR